MTLQSVSSSQIGGSSLSEACALLAQSQEPKDKAIFLLFETVIRGGLRQNQEVQELQQTVQQLQEQVKNLESALGDSLEDLLRVQMERESAHEQIAEKHVQEEKLIFSLQDCVLELKHNAILQKIETLEQRIRERCQLQKITTGFMLLGGTVSLASLTLLLPVVALLRGALFYAGSGFALIPTLQRRQELREETIRDQAFLECLYLLRDRKATAMDALLSLYRQGRQAGGEEVADELLRSLLAPYILDGNEGALQGMQNGYPS